MTLGAWLMLGATWAIVAFFAGSFVLRILRTPASGATDRGRNEE